MNFTINREMSDLKMKGVSEKVVGRVITSRQLHPIQELTVFSGFNPINIYNSCFIGFFYNRVVIQELSRPRNLKDLSFSGMEEVVE